MDPPKEELKSEQPKKRDWKEWWLKLCERLAGPVLWLLAKWIDRLLEQHAHHG
jgi:hypothetical protein